MINRSAICTAQGQGQILADWLSANAAAYFDSVVYDSTANTVTCYVGELDFLTLKPDALNVNGGIVIKNTGGQTRSSRLYGSGATAYMTTGYTCTNGVVLSNCSADSMQNTPGIIIAKDESGNTGIIHSETVSYRSSSGYGSNGFTITSSADTGVQSNTPFTMSPYQSGYVLKTVFCPAVSTCVSSPHYFPHVYLTPWNQAPGTGKLTANGQDYLTTGLVAIKD